MGLEGIALGWTDIGAGAIVILAVLMIFTGRLVPRRYYEDMQEQRDTWRASAEESREMNATLVQRADATLAILQSLDAQARKGSGTA